ncbi:MAG: protein translocase SEC61 complex subunit gamma [Nanoarchaeota archaeon]|nr:protein translocase SEC61 complex subunit gamma [Nanoarchaeota archaeon]
MINRISSSFSSKFTQYLRVWRLLKKPTYSEFKTISKVSAVGVMVIGAIGFVISVSIKLFF